METLETKTQENETRMKGENKIVNSLITIAGALVIGTYSLFIIDLYNQHKTNENQIKNQEWNKKAAYNMVVEELDLNKYAEAHGYSNVNFNVPLCSNPDCTNTVFHTPHSSQKSKQTGGYHGHR